jgi:Domain of unknown function (DUF4303)
MSNFDHEKMLAYSLEEIKKFSRQHQNETFYGFSIDAMLLCLNSVEAFEKSLEECRSRYPQYYQTEKQLMDLKLNTGDWAYQGFAELGSRTGFDHKAYDYHYDNPSNTTDYAIAMNKLIDALVANDAFSGLKKTNDFFVNRVEHNY